MLKIIKKNIFTNNDLRKRFNNIKSLLESNKIGVLEYRNEIKILLKKVNISRNTKLGDSDMYNRYYPDDINKDVFLKSDIGYEKKNLSNSTLSTQKTKQILKALEKYEKTQDFLALGITLNNLAPKLNTNSKYLSKIINTHKKKSFTQYINDLRIEYLLKKLDDDPIYTKYKITAIAKEIGFNTPKAFSKAFFKKTGITPSEYIKKLSS
jgi:AraC-like DNA-binding protein